MNIYIQREKQEITPNKHSTTEAGPSFDTGEINFNNIFDIQNSSSSVVSISIIIIKIKEIRNRSFYFHLVAVKQLNIKKFLKI